MLKCLNCKKEYSIDDTRWRCDCKSLLDIYYQPERHLFENLPSGNCSLWKFINLIPIRDKKNIITLGEGFTPLIELSISNMDILVKNESLFPTCSYKDRGAAVLISKIKELGIKTIVEDSSGNAGVSISAYSAKAGIQCHIYVPESASEEKITQITASGAIIHKIPGPREKSAEEALKAAAGAYYASHTWNPFFFQGTKTFAYEIWEQMNYSVPDTIFFPVGGGTLLIGAFIGFNDLYNLKLIYKIPKFIAIQSKNCSPISNQFNEKSSKRNKFKDTIAEGIAIKNPIRIKTILHILRITGGRVITVSEEEIKKSLLKMISMGYFIEPTSATVFAGLNKYRKKSNEKILVPITGQGLKTVNKINELLKK